MQMTKAVRRGIYLLQALVLCAEIVAMARGDYAIAVAMFGLLMVLVGFTITWAILAWIGGE